MQPSPEKQSPAGGRGFAEQQTNERGLQKDHSAQYHAAHPSADPLIDRLDAVIKAGAGWRARCPACGGRSRKLSIAVTDERVLLHCFAGCDGNAVLQVVGLQWADLQPPRNWPRSPDEQRRDRRAIRESGWASALEVLRIESLVVRFAAMQLNVPAPLSPQDAERLALACDRIERAALVLVERESWKPDDCYPPARLVSLKRDALSELQRQVERAERELRAATLACDALGVAA